MDFGQHSFETTDSNDRDTQSHKGSFCHDPFPSLNAWTGCRSRARPIGGESGLGPGFRILGVSIGSESSDFTA